MSVCLNLEVTSSLSGEGSQNIGGGKESAIESDMVGLFAPEDGEVLESKLSLTMIPNENDSENTTKTQEKYVEKRER